MNPTGWPIVGGKSRIILTFGRFPTDRLELEVRSSEKDLLLQTNQSELITYFRGGDSNNKSTGDKSSFFNF